MAAESLRRLVIFDLDGTLIDSRADLATAVNIMRVHFGLPRLPQEQITGFVGDGLRKLVERATDGTSVDSAEAIPVVQVAYRRHLLDTTAVYPGVPGALAQIRGLGYRTAVVTNKPQEFTLRILDHLGLLDQMDTVIGGDVCVGLKPDPAPLLLALANTECVAAGSWMVGDNHTDLVAGQRAGLLCCFCEYGFGERLGLAASLVVDHIEGFVEELRRSVCR